MGELPPTNADGTLGTSEGFPYRLAPAALPDISKAVRACLGAVGLGLAVSTLFLTLTFIATPGVLADDPGGIVQTVEEQGFAWRDGIRSGQVVVAMSAADDPGGWRIETIDSDGVYRISSAAGIQAAVERTTIIALAAVIIAAIGLMLRSRRGPRLCAGNRLGRGARSHPFGSEWGRLRRLDRAGDRSDDRWMQPYR